MLRIHTLTLLVCVTSSAAVCAADAVPQGNRTLVDWLKADSGRRQTPTAVSQAPRAYSQGQQAGRPRLHQRPVVPAGATGMTPVHSAPVLPNQSPVSGPQYFSAVNGQGLAQPVHPGRSWQRNPAPQPVYVNSPGMYSHVGNNVAGPVITSGATLTPSNSRSGAPLSPGTALYPSPVPGVPQQIGGTSISNQFLNPHEMLYAHQYRALYGPYSYKVCGKWIVTPFGVWSHEDWRLMGTQVDVKYKSHISKFALFTPPNGH